MTDVRTDGVIREVLHARDSLLRVDGMVREVLRSTATGIATYIATDGMVREVLMPMPVVSRGGPMVTMIW